MSVSDKSQKDTRGSTSKIFKKAGLTKTADQSAAAQSLAATETLKKDIPSLQQRGNLQPGDVVIFRKDKKAKLGFNLQSMISLFQKFHPRASMKKQSDCVHAAVVIGVAQDGMPIISHVMGGGLRTERLDWSPYKYIQFDVFRIMDEALKKSVAEKAAMDPDLLTALKNTGKKGATDEEIKNPDYKNSADTKKALEGFGHEKQNKQGDPIFAVTPRSEKAPKFKYAVFNVLRAAVQGDSKINRKHETPKRNPKKLQSAQFCTQLVWNSLKESIKEEQMTTNKYTQRDSKHNLIFTIRDYIMKRTSKILPAKLYDMFEKMSAGEEPLMAKVSPKNAKQQPPTPTAEMIDRRP